MRCEQAECEAPATQRMFWPNESPVLVCERHKDWALRIASVMGFQLYVEPYPLRAARGEDR